MTDQPENDEPTFEERVEKGVSHAQKTAVFLRRVLEDEIDAARNDADIVRLARAYAIFREKWESLNTHIDDVNAVFRGLSEITFPEMLEKTALRNVPLEDIGRAIGTRTQTKSSIKTGLKEDAIAFLQADKNALEFLDSGQVDDAIPHLKIGRRNDMAGLLEKDQSPELVASIADEIRKTTHNFSGIVVEHVFPQTLSAVAKDLANMGEELPEDLFSTYLHTSTTWRKLSSK